MDTKFKRKLSLLMLVSITGASMAFAAPNYNYQQNVVQTPQYQGSYYPTQNYSKGPLKGRVIVVPPGAQIPAIVSTPISSEYLTMGQPVSVTLGSDFYYSNTLIAPAGSTVSGTVTQVTKAKHGSMNGSLRLRFTEIITPYGSRIPISAMIRTADGTGLLVGGTKADVAKNYAKDMGVGAGAGALTGLIASAISGGAIGKGTAIMTGVGASAGLAKSLYDKGCDVVIPANSTIELQVDQPITVNPSGYSDDY
ncbi:MAG: hypothetical protein PHC64_06370 [Candidatus Gastranaerophilales bacterium]|nr:hypothetical protein [Candidatus Gastranaerophilales bacterium]